MGIRVGYEDATQLIKLACCWVQPIDMTLKTNILCSSDQFESLKNSVNCYVNLGDKLYDKNL